jgi:hypothetical protein
MAKVSEEAKGQYSDKLKEFKAHVETIKTKELAVLAAIRAGSGDVGLLKVSQVDTALNLASYYHVMNSLSVSLLEIRNEGHLNDARKIVYKAIILLEGIVSNLIDAPFSEYEERLAALDAYDDAKRYALVRKLGFAIESIEEAFGDNTKWRWGFVEIEARFATVVKNLVNFRTLNAKLDPRHASYPVVSAHVSLSKRLLQQAADRYREKYELSTLRFEDMKLAIEYLSALRRVHIMLGESDEADVVKKKIEVWKNKMEQDQRKAEETPKK